MNTLITLEDSRFPIVIGITGHRNPDAESIPVIRVQIEAQLRKWQQDYPHTPLVLLSPLAEGADRLAAEAAIDLGVKLVVPLPMEQGEYERDFTDPDSLRKFRQLLSRALSHFDLPLLPGVTPQSVRETEAHRALQYAQAGTFIAARSQVLLALWDGQASNRTGGTAQVVDYKLNGIPEPFALPHRQLEAVDTGPVFQIVTPREGAAPPAARPGTLVKHFPKGWQSDWEAEQALNAILARMNQYNRDVPAVAPSLTALIVKERDDVIPPSEAARLMPQRQADLQRYAVASALSMHFATRRRRMVFWLNVLPVPGVLAFNFYGNLWPLWWLALLYPAALAVNFALARWANRLRFQDRHVDYRALAEGLRIQLFWSLCGLETTVAQRYLRHERTDIEWVRNAVRGLDRPTSPEAPQELIDLTIARWVNAQLVWLQGKSESHRRSQKPAEVWSPIIYGVSIGLVLFVVLFNRGVQGQWPILHQALLVLVGMGPILIASLQGYTDKMAFSLQSRSYRRMHLVYLRASRHLEKCLAEGNPEGVRETLQQLGEAALAEHAEWVQMYRDRPLSPPVV